ncbi:MAG: hypothetical protein IJT97_04425 [Bacteroidaceae bacterium]|nr:hypothetical protein [Bacteroidaceae bacterium]
MKKIVLSPEFIDELEDLLDALIEGLYFSKYEYAIEYINSIELFISQSIHTYPKRKIPGFFSKYGTNLKYITYNKNPHTTWYIMFEETNEEYFVRHITNNHVSGQYFNMETEDKR